MVKLTQDQIDDITRRLRMLPIEFEERIPTLDRPLIIESAGPGWQPRYWGPREIYPETPPGYTGEGTVRYPAVPISIEDQVKLQVEAVKLGAQCIHLHPRDPKTGISPEFQEGFSDLMISVLERTLNEVDCITLQHSWKGRGGHAKDFKEETAMTLARGGIDYISDTKHLLEAGKGNKYCQGALVLWPPRDSYPPGYNQDAQEGVKFMEENDVRPIVKFRGLYHVRKMKRVLIDTGIVKKKLYILVHDMGHPMGWPMDIDPWVAIDMISAVTQTKSRVPDSIIGVYPGGRNWLPITLMAILIGVDIVRVGIEDSYWMYPHRDDIIQSNSETIKLTVDFARMVGREVATVEQARKIMGIKLTSK